MHRADVPPSPGGIDFRHIAVLCAVVVLLMSAVSLANLSVPLIAESELRPTPSQQTWFVDAFVLAFACSLLPAEMIGARFGEERMLALGLAAFIVANVVALLSPTMGTLIVARALAGAGAGLALPQSLSVLLRRSERHQHARLVAIWTAATSAAGIVGNGFGGVLLSAGGWRSAFAVTAPVAVVVMALVVVLVGVRARPTSRVSLDVSGTVLFVVASLAALFALVEAPHLVSRPWALVVLVLVVFVTGGLFWRRETRAAHPLLRVEVFGLPPVRAAALGIAATFIGLFTLFSLNAHLVQTVRGLDAWVAGLALVPVSVAMLLVTSASVRLVARFGLGRVVASGLLVSILGYVALIVGLRGPFLAYEAALVVIGVGAGLCSSPLSTRLTSEYSAAEGRAGSGINSTLRELASASGVAVAGLALAFAVPERNPSGAHVVDASTAAFWVVIGVLAVSCAVMIVDTRARRR